jgi:hypothetical protein
VKRIGSSPLARYDLLQLMRLTVPNTGGIIAGVLHAPCTSSQCERSRTDK